MTTTDTNPSEQAPEKRRGRLPAQSIDNCVLDPEDRWLSPKTVAVMLDFSEDWLSQLREGLKGIEGPPFKKLGDAKSSPVRYNLARLREWMNRFPELASNAGAAPTFFISMGDFINGTSLEEPWLFAQIENESVDFFKALNEGLFDIEPEPELHWMTIEEWLDTKPAILPE